jgi:hypothetical protein
MERGWLEAGKGGPYVPGRHPAEWGGSWSGRGFGPGRPDQPERLRETPVQASPWPGRTHPADRPSRASSDTKAFAGSMVKGASAGQTSHRVSQFRPFRGVRQLRSMRLGGQNRRLSNHAGRLTQLPILVCRVPLGDAVGLSPLTQSGARRTVRIRLMVGFGDDVLRARALPEARRGDLLRLYWGARNNVGNSVGVEI